MLFRFSVFSFIFSAYAFSWGHLDFLNNDWAQSSLTYTVVHKQRIHYCVEVENENRFPPKQISKEVKMALEVWLTGADLHSKTLIREVPCIEHPDLVVQIAKETEFPELSGYQVPRYEAERYYSNIRLNSEYSYAEHSGRYKVSTFASFFPIPQNEERIIREISLQKPLDLKEFSSKYNVNYQSVYLSTYKMLLHEVGHAFGLCDTEESLFRYCDTRHRSHNRPPAIMNNADFFYLTPDDKMGIRAVFKRFQK